MQFFEAEKEDGWLAGRGHHLDDLVGFPNACQGYADIVGASHIAESHQLGLLPH